MVRVKVRVALLIQLEGRLYIDIKNAIYTAYRHIELTSVISSVNRLFTRFSEILGIR